MKSIVICASKRYKDEVFAFCDELEAAQIVVFRPNIGSPIQEDKAFESPHVARMVFKGLTLEHFDMVRKSDVCFVYNKSGYAGVSVSLEMGFATALGKPLYALENQTGDPCRDSLIDRVVSSASELIGLLQ
jgi:hypothetical protein